MADLASTIKEMGTAFEDFKGIYDKRLAEMEGVVGALETVAGRRGFGGGSGSLRTEDMRDFNAFLRTGHGLKGGTRSPWKLTRTFCRQRRSR